MNSVLKATMLDFSLLKPYGKAICFVLLLPVAFVFVSRSFFLGVSFAMCLMAMASSYTFAVSEKNGMDRLYGILPIAKRQFVLGKYICVCAMGLLTLLVSLAVQTLVLMLLSEQVNLIDLMTAGAIGLVQFVLFVALQIPCYYKYGSIKGKLFMYIPILGLIGTSIFFQDKNIVQIQAVNNLLENPIALAVFVLVLIVIMIPSSIAISTNILEKKED